MRVDVDWSAIGIHPTDHELRPGANNWTALDITIDQAVRCRGLNVLASIAYTPTWATQRFRYTKPESLRARHLPDDLNEWRAFVREAVARYPEVRHWSIWNEPNSPDFFLGWDGGLTTSLTEDYNRLLDAALPGIVGNPDGQGPRTVVGLELAGGSQAQIAPWIRDVLGGRHKFNIGVFAYHHYGRAVDIRDKLYNLAAQHNADVGAGGWRWPVWLTEAGLSGCNDYRLLDGSANLNARSNLQYCVGDSLQFIRDDVQASDVRSLLDFMRQAPPSARWMKTFYWHSHTQTNFNPATGGWVGSNTGLLNGARQNSISGRPAFTAYADVAGPLGMYVAGDPSYPIERTVSATALPAVPSPQLPYYYAWEWTWCSTGGGPYDCPGVWYYYGQGLDYHTVSAYVRQQDYWVRLRVRQYTAAPAQGGTLLSEAWDTFLGPGLCAPDASGGCPMRAAPTPPEPDDSRFATATGVPAPCGKASDVNCRRTWGARGGELPGLARGTEGPATRGGREDDR